MNNIDFSECSFIEDQMQFYTYYDFCENRRAIKRLFRSLTLNGKIFYKYYVYANIHTRMIEKNKIWDYLNDYADDFELLRLGNFYNSGNF